MRELRRAAHTVYSLQYHFVFTTKYRKPVLLGEIGHTVRDLIREIYCSEDIEMAAYFVPAMGMKPLCLADPSATRCNGSPNRRAQPATNGHQTGKPTPVFQGRLRSASTSFSLRGWRSQERGGSNPPFCTSQTEAWVLSASVPD